MIALLWLQLSTIISPLVSSPLLLLVYLANYPYEQEGPPKRVRTCSWFNPVKKKPFLATVVCLGVMFLWRSQVSLRCWNILFPTHSITSGIVSSSLISAMMRCCHWFTLGGHVCQRSLYHKTSVVRLKCPNKKQSGHSRISLKSIEL